jgi:ferrochelatase
MARTTWQTHVEQTGSTALVVLNMGGPDCLESVEPFLRNLFSDRDLIRLPGGRWLQRPFARLMSRLRSNRAREAYRAIGGASPLRDWTERQARAMADELGPDWRAEVAMRYWSPRADEVTERLRRSGVRRAMVLSLYPHFTTATSGSSIKDFCLAAVRHCPRLDYRLIPEWHAWPPFLDVLAESVREGLHRFPADQRARGPLLFSAHALPRRLIDRGDPYLDQVKETVRGVLRRLPACQARLAFQSRSGPVRWTEPSVNAVLDELAAAGHRSVLMVPVSFVCDHIETLHEIDHDYRDYALQRGLRHFERTASFNDRPGFIRALAALVASQVPAAWRPDVFPS